MRGEGDSSAVEVMRAREAYLPGITEIYNDAILTTTATFDTEVKTLSDRREWFAAHGERFPILVALQRDQVVGWGAITEYSPRPAYRFTGEDSIYVHPGHRGKGIGGVLLARLVDEAKALQYHSLIGRVVDGNAASLRLHEAAGFVEVGRLREVGMKFGSWLDVLFVQLLL